MDQDQGVGREIKRLREERGWSMAKLAVEADMSVSGVSMIENGKRNLTTTTLAKLARAYGVEIADLFPKAEAPLPFEESGGRRREVIGGLMSDVATNEVDLWEREIEKRSSPSLSRRYALNCHDRINEITRAAALVEKWGSGELTNSEWDAVREEFEAERAQWWALQDRLYEIARKGFEHYEEAAAAGEVRELWELQERREEIRRLTRELSA